MPGEPKRFQPWCKGNCYCPKNLMLLSYSWIWRFCFIVVANWYRNLYHVQANLIAMLLHHPHQGKKPMFLMKCRSHKFGEPVKMHLAITCIVHAFTMLPSSHRTSEGPTPILHFFYTYLKKLFSSFPFILPGGRSLIWSRFTLMILYMVAVHQPTAQLDYRKYYVNF